MKEDNNNTEVKPYHPLPFRNGNKVVKRYVERFTDGAGHVANITYVDYVDNKGKLVERVTLFVNWFKSDD